MQRLFAIVCLTWKAAFRFRLFLVMAVLLLASVVALPILIKDDGTAQGFTQILLTYTLSVITALLGLSTLWLSCGTLARDIEDCQMQVVAVKPVARWQIWLGKWLGVVSLNAVLLALAGAGVYALLQWRATKLPPEEQHALRTQVLVARGSIKEESHDSEIDKATEELLQERLKQSNVTVSDMVEVRSQIRDQVVSVFQVVPPAAYREWQIHLGARKDSLRGKPLQLRIKFRIARADQTGTYPGLWEIGVPGKTKFWRSDAMSLEPDTFHEFEIQPDLFDNDGLLTIRFINVNPLAVLFMLDDGMEVLYPEGGFGLNYIRALGIIFCWMALLSAIGLAAASFLSFPVAAFFSLGVLCVAFSGGTLASVIAQGGVNGTDPETGIRAESVLDDVIVPAFRATLNVVNLAQDFSPIDALSTGRSISWTELGRAFGQVVLLLGIFPVTLGIFLFSRRELATAQGSQ